MTKLAVIVNPPLTRLLFIGYIANKHMTEEVGL